jgi:methyl-accepting chemotaxis protein
VQIANRALAFDGVTLATKVRDAIFINADRVSSSPMAVVGHELVHLLKQDRPDLYRQLEFVVRDGANVRQFIADYRAKYANDPTVAKMSDGKIEEELVADLVANRLLERGTWEKLAYRRPGVFERLASAVIGYLNDMIARARNLGARDADRYVRDLTKVRDVVADVLAEYADSQGRLAARVAPKGDIVATKIEDSDELDFARRLDTEASIRDRWGAPDVGMRMSLADRAVSLDRFVYGTAPSPFTEKRPTQLQIARFYDAMAEKHDAVRTEFTDENRKAISRILTYEALLAVTKDTNAVGWYEGKVNGALTAAAQLHPEIATDEEARFAFTVALAITSNGMTVPDNARFAFEVYEAFKRDGKMPSFGKGERALPMRTSFGMFNQLVEKLGSVAAAKQFVTSKYNVRDLKRQGFTVDGLVDEDVYGGVIFGPKIGGGFLMNLNGYFDTLTIDRWNMRTWGRVTGKMMYGEERTAKVRARFVQEMKAAGLKGDPETVALQTFSKFARAGYTDRNQLNLAARQYWAVLKPIDAPSSDAQRAFIRATYLDTQKALVERGTDISIADLQALLWYPEKELYVKFGASNERAEPTDYEQEIRKHVEGRSVRGTQPGRGRGDASAERAAGTQGAPAPAAGADQVRVSVGRSVRGGDERLAVAGRTYQGPREKLKNAPGPIEVPGLGKVDFGLHQTAVDAATRYMARAGLPFRQVKDYVKVDVDRAKRIAAAYEAMPHAPNDPQVKAAYDAMIRETVAQYEAILETGLQVEFIDYAKQGDPYQASPRLAVLDVIENNHLWVFSTRDGFGSSEFDPSTNPLLQETPHTISGQPALANDIFRVVHDYFGHVKNGVGFRADGEENAWRAHSTMYTPLARRAMTSETRGQNSWLNFGPHGEANRTAKSAATVYADQKTGLMPEWTATDGAPQFARTESPAFKRWFEGSKVVDEHGAPMVVYHGSPERGFTVFDKDKINANDPDGPFNGFYFSSSQEDAHTAGSFPWGRPNSNGEVRPFFLALRNPVTRRQANKVAREIDRDWEVRHPDARSWQDATRMELQKRGHDGIVFEPYVIPDRAAFERDGKVPFGKSNYELRKNTEYSSVDLYQGEEHITGYESFDQAVDMLKAGVYVAFEPGQIKSVNAQEFDATNPDVTFARLQVPSAHAIRERLTQAISDHFTTERTFNWWNRTVGSQVEKARKSPEFKRVFDKVQDFIHDTSRFAMRASDLAPTLLPKLENWRETLNIKKDITGQRKRDMANVSDVIYQGTLDREVYTDADLQRRGLTPDQVKLYNEARAAVNKSLEDMAVSTLHRVARSSRVDVGDLRDIGMQEARTKLSQALKEKRDAANEELTRAGEQLVRVAGVAQDAGLSAAAIAETTRRARERVEDAQRRIRDLTDTLDEIDDTVGRVTDLQNQGYFPLMRWGDYTLYVTRKDGSGETEQLMFQMFETESDRRKAARASRELFPGAKVEEGVASQEVYKMFAGINLDSLEVLADAVGASENAVFQRYLKLAVSNRSALKRMIGRKDVPGFERDISRTLAQFLTSNARLTSRNYHWAEAKSGVSAIPKPKGDVADEAAKLVKYIEDPTEESQAIRGLSFAWFLGGAIDTALLNLTQPAMVTLPYLTKWGEKQAVAAMTRRQKEAFTGKTTDAELARALKRAEADGVVAPQEIYHLYAEASRSLGSNLWVRRGMRLWGAAFSYAEAVNRRLTFSAAFDVGRAISAEQLAKAGVKDAYDFASKAVDETQFVYSKANRPNWGRGTIGSVVFQFKTFAINSIELFYDHLTRHGLEGKKAAAYMVAMWVLASGAQGLPGSDDLEDLIDTIGQMLGYDVRSKEQFRAKITKWAVSVLGQDGGDFVAGILTRGISGAVGSPLDVSQRMSLGNLVPASGLLKRSNENRRAQELAELAGPAGGFLKQLFDAFEAYQAQGLGAAARTMMPRAGANVGQALDMAKTGKYRDNKGKNVIDVSPSEAVTKGFGFQPGRVARASREDQAIQERVALQKVFESDIADKITRSRYDAAVAKSPSDEKAADAQLDDAIAALSKWNQSNPEMPIKIKGSDITRRVKQMMLDRRTRVLKSAPVEMRGIIASEMGDRP